MKHIAALDGVRGFAVIVVMLAHFGLSSFAGGGLGVDVFFVLSGYLITSILYAEITKTGSLDVRRFFAKRARRLLPALAIALVLGSLLTLAFSPPAEVARLPMNVVAAGLFFMDFHVAAREHVSETGMLGHTWSLAVEEHFYMLWPALLLAAFKARSLLTGLVLAWVLATVYYASGQIAGVPADVLHFRTDYRLSGLMLGSALAVFLARGGRFERAGLYGMALAPVIVFMLMRPSEAVILKHALTEIFTALVIFAIVQGDKLWSVLLSWRFLTYAGQISYGLYLYHKILVRALWQADMSLLLGLPLSLMLAVASFHLIERPILRSGKKRSGKAHVATSMIPVADKSANVQ